MARGSKAKYTNKQKRQAAHIEKSYEKRGVSEKTAEARAWATVNKTSGGGKKSGSGRGKAPHKASTGTRKSTSTRKSATTKRGTPKTKTRTTRRTNSKKK